MANIRSEQTEHIKVVHWVKSKTCLKVIHIRNEGVRGYAEQAIIKRMGLCKGASDLFFPASCGAFKGLFLELKSFSGKLSPEQTAFLDEMTQLGYLAVCCWGAEAAIKFIQEAYGLAREDNR